MEPYQENLISLLAREKALFFDDNLFLKDGRPTPYFVNFGKLNKGRESLELGRLYAQMLVGKNLTNEFDIIFGLSYKGSALAIATAHALYSSHTVNKPFEYDRKEAKAYGDASKDSNFFVTGALFNGARILMIDDVATSMDTKGEALEKITAEAERKNWKLSVTGIAVAFDRQQTTAVYDQEVPIGLNDKDLSQWKKQHVQLGVKGEDAKKKFAQETGIPIYSIVGGSESIDFLHSHPYIKVSVNKKMSSLDDETKRIFDEYQQIYGI